jgi:hypothetical protein
MQTDSVVFLTKTEVNTYGSIAQTWTNGATVKCDVQPISREQARKNYGLEANSDLKQVFDHTNAAWVLGDQVKFDSVNWWVKLVNKFNKISGSDHTFIILERVV